MIVDCGACSAQNFVSRERLAARDVPPRCWKCGRALAIDAGRGEIPSETSRSDPESNDGTEGGRKDGGTKHG
ncbi:MJ0042-type zinc finger domain-containing protein [Candidatus Deferrimicrobium sp.]|uniref:MJ0042-type zinc finger domain-containing protein n=1 Tax=Candidatus Deferrimicrobium sp. TaxID=3060586 RepID=UPI0039C89DD5